MTPRAIIEQEARLGEKFRRSPRIVADEVMDALERGGFVVVERPTLTVGVRAESPWSGQRYELRGVAGDELLQASYEVSRRGLMEGEQGVREYVARRLRHEYLHAIGERLGLA